MVGKNESKVVRFLHGPVQNLYPLPEFCLILLFIRKGERFCPFSNLGLKFLLLPFLNVFVLYFGKIEKAAEVASILKMALVVFAG